jgi:hypothetical protein
MSMNAPHVVQGQWILVGTSSIDSYVFSINNNGSLEVGYYQNRIKAIKETVVWSGAIWEFEIQGPSGSYLRGAEEALVIRGPRG